MLAQNARLEPSMWLDKQESAFVKSRVSEFTFYVYINK